MPIPTPRVSALACVIGAIAMSIIIAFVLLVPSTKSDEIVAEFTYNVGNELHKFELSASQLE